MRLLKYLAFLGLILLLAACGGTPGGNTGAKGSVSNPSPKPLGNQTAAFYISNTGSPGSSLSWNISIPTHTFNGKNQDWLEVKPTQGSTSGGDQTPIYLYFKDASPAAGTYKATLKISFAGSSQTLEVSATIGSNSGAKLALNPDSITLKQGQTSGAITVSHSGFSGDVGYDARRGNATPAGILDIKFSAPTFTITAHSDAPPGTYQVIITATDGSQQASATLDVTVTSSGGGGSGTGSIQGTVKTDNAAIPFNPITVQSLNSLAGPQAQRPPFVPGELLVKYKGGLSGQSVQTYQQSVQALAQRYSLTVLKAALPGQAALLKLPAGADMKQTATRLSQDPAVAYAEPNYYVYAQAIPNDTDIGKEWEMPASGVPLAWDVKNSSDVTVAVIDTGIALDHQDLSGIFVSDGYDFCASTKCLTTDDNPRPDDNSDTHGTHVTGILAAKGNNGQGVAGILYGGAKILPIKVFQGGVTTVDALSDAIRWAAGISVSAVPDNTHPAKIINLSLGSTTDSQTLHDAVNAAQQKGVLIVAAAGNDGANSLRYPAAYGNAAPGVILGVGSVNGQFQRSCFSDYGDGLDLMAAGGDGNQYTGSFCAGRTAQVILSTFPGNTYGQDAGTSMATPVVSGIAALVWEQHSDWTATQVAQQLESTAYFGGSMNKSEYGYGIVRADAALGLPGPGDDVAITATGTANGDQGTATTTLKADGSPSSFTINNLDAGNYTLTANAQGSPSLSGQATVSVSDGQTATKDITLQP